MPRIYHHIVPIEGCPAAPEDSAERYCLGRMSSAEAKGFERHVASCDRCAAAVRREREIVRLMRAAGRGMRRVARKRTI